MKTTKILTILSLTMCLILCSAQIGLAAAVGTAFTYQGHLYDTNDVANGEYDFQFKLYDANTGGGKIGSDVHVSDVDVIDGYFTAELDFGSSAFDGDVRWLQIGVRPGVENDPCAYTPLVPRQEVTPTPYALYAKTASAGNSLDASDGSPTDAVYVDNEGNVGIGTTSPAEKLHVYEPTSGNYGQLGRSDCGAYAGHGSTGNFGFLASSAYGAYGYSQSGEGVYGQSSTDIGVCGRSTSGNGVYGEHLSSSNYGYIGSSSYGVYGNNSGNYGILGRFDSGVHGEHSSGSYGRLGGSNYGVYGSGSDFGVSGSSTGGSAVRGQSSSGSGMFGTSNTGYGLYGQTTSGNCAVYGRHDNSNNYGKLGSSTYGVRGEHDSTGNYGELGRYDWAVYGYNSDSGNYAGLASFHNGVWGKHNSSGNHGVLGNSDYGVYGYGGIGDYDFYAGGPGTDYGSSSSIRWKSNIQNIDKPLEKLVSLRGVYFNWDNEHGGHHDVGMIAEEVGQVLPEIVDYEKNGVDALGMDYSKLTPLLVEAVKALKTEVDQLQKENSDLRNRLEALEKMMPAKGFGLQKGVQQ